MAEKFVRPWADIGQGSGQHATASAAASARESGPRKQGSHGRRVVDRVHVPKFGKRPHPVGALQEPCPLGLEGPSGAHGHAGEHIDVPALGQPDRPPPAVGGPAEGGGDARSRRQLEAAVEQIGTELRGVHSYLQSRSVGVGPRGGQAPVKRRAPLIDHLEPGRDPVPRRAVQSQDPAACAAAGHRLEGVGESALGHPRRLLE